MSDDFKEQLRKDAQGIGAAVSRRCWQSVESAYNVIRDRIDGYKPAAPTAEDVREACAKVAEGWVACDHNAERNVMADIIARDIRAMPLPQAEAAKVEPVAWLYRNEDRSATDQKVVSLYRWPSAHQENWIETPLIPAPKGQSDE